MKTNKTNKGIAPGQQVLRQPSLRVQADIRAERAYLDEHPELDNVTTYHLYKALPKSAIYFDRFGHGMVYVNSVNRHYWKQLGVISTISAACRKKRIKKAYKRFSWYVSSEYIKNRRIIKLFNLEVHRAIAEMYVDHVDIFANEIDHIDGDKYNNRYDNLEYVTHEENIRRRYYNYYLERERPIPERFLPKGLA